MSTTKVAYALQHNEGEERQAPGSSSVYMAVAAIMIAFVAVTLGAVAMSENHSTIQRVDTMATQDTVASSSHNTKSAIRAAISAHPSCSTNLMQYTACMDTMRVASELAVANSSATAISNGAFTFKSADAALVINHKVCCDFDLVIAVSSP
jgi:hypothetical protein